MGLIENGTREFQSCEKEKLEISEILPHDANCGPLAPGKHELNSEIMVAKPVEQELVSGAQSNEKILVSMEASYSGIEEMGPSSRDILQNFDVEKGKLKLDHVNTLSVIENTELPPQNGSTNVGNMAILTDSDSINPDYGKLEQMQKNAALDPCHLENEAKGTNAKSRNGKTKLRNSVTGSWVLRNNSQEKPKTAETNDTVKDGSANEERRKRGRKKGAKKSPVSEFSRTRNHLRYLLHRIKYEQSLIDAYCAEGWKGQSVEKLKPEKELQQAKSHILRYKLKIRNLFQHLDLSLAVGQLPESLFDSVGEIDSEDIFCAKCGSKDLSLDNDIILCDGACERGFHQFCLKPPLLKSQIPPDDEGWLCPACDCKVDCIDMLRDFQGTNLSITDSWEKIFPEAVAMEKKMGDGSGSSDDSDDDYDPDKLEIVEKVQGDESSSDESNYFSASDDLVAAPDDEKYLGLPSDDSADNDFDPAASDSDQDKKVNQSSSSSDFTSDSEDLGALLDDAAAMPDIDSPPSSSKLPTMATEEKNHEVGGMKGQSLKAELAYLLKSVDEPVSGKRHVERLDYKKLLEETYGNSSSDSSDEGFDDTTASKRRKTSREKTVTVSQNKFPIVKSKIDTDDENQKGRRHLRRQNLRCVVDRGINESSTDDVSSSSHGKRPAHKRLGEAVTQKLYQSFKESQYPQRDAKENLAKELGISIRQVSKWFENARWSYNHRPQLESNTPVKKQAAQVLNHSNAIPDQSHTLGANVEKLVTDTGEGDSGIRKSRKRKDKNEQGLSSRVDAQSPQLAGVISNRRQTRSNKTIT